SSRNRSVLRYFLFESLNTVATTASPPRSSCASIAARKFAPLEIPTPSPSSVASFCAMRIASPSSTAITRSSSSRCTMGGMNSSLTPWMRCLPTLWPVESVGEFAGSIGWRRIAGFRLRRKRPAPMIVPPVPTPATNAAGTRRSDCSCAQSSGPVVRKCASLFASLLNWRGRNEPGVSAASSSASLIDPRKPPSAGDTRRTLAPNDLISAMRSALIQSDMKIVTGCPSARPIAQNEIPVLPLVASMIIPPAWSAPDSSAWRTMCSAILSLMLSVRLRFSAFAYRRRVRPLSTEKSIASNGVLPTSTRRPRSRSASENLFMASWRKVWNPRSSPTRLKTAHHDVRDQREEEENQQHPGDALESPHYGVVDLERPAVGVQRDDGSARRSRHEVFLEGRDPHAAADPHDVDREDDVAVPGGTQIL